MLSSLRLFSILYVVQSAVLQKLENSYSFVVNVHVLTPSGLMGNCIGSLISPTFVITAAHCGSEGQTGYVTVPSKNITSEIATIHRFEKINDQSPMKKDVAIVKLHTSISAVTPVKLSSFFDDLNAAVALLSYHKDTTTSRTMRMKLKHPEECDRYGIYTPLYFCAGETEISTEAGDSGAPVIVESSVPTQVGVVIGQQQLDQNNLSNGNLNPTVILKIPLFCDWIRNVTKGVRCI